MNHAWQPQALTFLLSIQRDVAMSPPPLVALFHMWQVIPLLCMYLNNKIPTQPHLFPGIFLSKQLIVCCEKIWNCSYSSNGQYLLHCQMTHYCSVKRPDFHSDFSSVPSLIYKGVMDKKQTQAHLAQMFTVFKTSQFATKLKIQSTKDACQGSEWHHVMTMEAAVSRLTQAKTVSPPPNCCLQVNRDWKPHSP